MVEAWKFQGGEEDVDQEDEGKNRGPDVHSQSVPVVPVVGASDNVDDESRKGQGDKGKDALEDANWEEPHWCVGHMRRRLAVAVGVHVGVKVVRHLCDGLWSSASVSVVRYPVAL